MQNLFSTLKVLPAALLLTTALFLGFSNKAEAQVSFSITATVNGNENTGTFTSQGLAASLGTFSESFSFNGKKVHSEATFLYVNGTITVKTHSDVLFTSPTTATGAGTWKISKGTGAYANIKGLGQLTYSLTGIGTSAEYISQEWVGSLQ